MARNEAVILPVNCVSAHKTSGYLYVKIGNDV